MKHDSRELAEVQQTAQAPAASRVDLYAGIHKALRAVMSDTLLAVGRMDAHDALELAQTTQRVLQLLDLMRSHLEHENNFVHKALEARAPGSSQHIGDDHVHHVAEIDTLAESVRALLDTSGQDLDAAVHGFYRRLSLFIAHNYEHMNYEETQHNATLWAHYSDEELMGIHAELVGSIPPEEMMLVMRWMVPFMNAGERAMVLGDMKAHAPAPAFEAVLGATRPHLSAREWEKLQAALELPAAA
ncbi:hypothetical protein QTH91_14795 [Variovorax dokdonensis]|uniref:Hemerythrin-like domain-containing protein n=1 Tax=Variovorax dokdonensis TaxID=344883 RepID=A0ABT7ND40_9BURK|nr:hypothetical protein [Variovorax dokdonensis]MDM0045755.1 hypothetical protein [Variovorax dokdonensis]